MLLVASASRNNSTVAGMLRDAISRKVAPIFVEANSAKDEPTTVKAAAKPNARYNRERIVWSRSTSAEAAANSPEAQFI